MSYAVVVLCVCMAGNAHDAAVAEYVAKIEKLGVVHPKPPADLAELLVETQEEYREQRLKQLQYQLDELSKEARQNRDDDTTTKQKRIAELQDIRQEINRLKREKDPLELPLPALRRDCKIGDIGLMPKVGTLKVAQVIDPKAMIVRLETSYVVTTADLRYRTKSSTRELWIQDVSTDKYADGDRIELPFVMHAGENKMLTSPDGTERTYPVLRPLFEVDVTGN